MSTTEKDTLAQRAAELREIANAPTERERAVRELAEVEQQIADQRKQEALADAKARLVAIKREFTGQLTEQADDDKRIIEARKKLSEANEKKNDRYRRFLRLAYEARELCKASGLALPEFASLKSVQAQVPAVALKNVPEPVALLDAPDVSSVMCEITGAGPDVARDDKLAAELNEVRRARLAEAQPHDVENERRALARFGNATPTPGYK